MKKYRSLAAACYLVSKGGDPEGALSDMYTIVNKILNSQKMKTVSATPASSTGGRSSEADESESENDVTPDAYTKYAPVNPLPKPPIDKLMKTGESFVQVTYEIYINSVSKETFLLTCNFSKLFSVRYLHRSGATS